VSSYEPQKVTRSVEPEGDVSADVVIIGSGMGGGTLAWALRHTGARVLLVERGDFLPREPQNWSPEAVFQQARYRNAEPWHDRTTGATFAPGVHYYVGGNTKVYGACLPRFREQDFKESDHADGISPAWPVTYADMEEFYLAAEHLYKVHGRPGEDPTEPWRSGDYPYPALEHEPNIAGLADALVEQGLHPFHMPMGIDRQPEGRCVRCGTCDGFPCRVDAKSDAETCAILPAIAEPTVDLLTRTVVRRLETSVDGRRITAAVAKRDGRPLRITASKFVVACGAVNTAALLLSSATDTHPAGLANGSGLLGRRYMVHNSTFFVAVDPRRRNNVTFQKTLGVNDWYLPADGASPLGNLQMLGKLRGPMVKAARPWAPMPALKFMTDHSIDMYLTTEDLPDHDNRVTVGPGGRIEITWRPNNLGPHGRLVGEVRRALRRAGYPLAFAQRMDIATNSHQCGTAVMGADPTSSVVDSGCRTHEVDNLWLADSSVFPSSAALNPALTIAANALRIAATNRLAA
jgi:choline dehydrogenase-like flavoprotein